MRHRTERNRRSAWTDYLSDCGIRTGVNAMLPRLSKSCENWMVALFAPAVEKQKPFSFPYSIFNDNPA